MGTSSAMSTSNQYIKYKITVNQNSQSISDNYSNVTVKVNFYRTNTGYTSYGTGTVYCKINGTTYTASVSTSQKITNSGIDLFSKTLNIYHNNDGTKTLTTSAWISHSVVTSSEQSYSQKLSTIPRASTISSISGNTLGSPITVNISRASSSFTHKVFYKRTDGNRYEVGSGVGTSHTFTPSINDSNLLPNATSGTAEITVDTYSGSTYIGYNAKNITIYVPSSIVPTIGDITLTESVSGIAEKFGGFVQWKSKIKASINASGSYSSTIKNYSSKINGATYTSGSFTTDYLRSGGDCAVTVKDSRGREVSKTVGFSATAYWDPWIDTFSVSRCNSDGSANDSGNCAKCVIKAGIAPVNDRNDKTFTIQYKKQSESSYQTVTLSNDNYTLETTQIFTDIDTESEYEFILNVTDYFTTSKLSRNISTAYTLMDFRSTGRGVAIGKVSTKDSFEVAMEVHAESNVRIGEVNNTGNYISFRNLASIQGKTYEDDGIYPHDTLIIGCDGNDKSSISFYDAKNSYCPLWYDDTNKRLCYGAEGLHSPSDGGVYFNEWGNVVTKDYMSVGYWGIVNGSTDYFQVNWGDKKISGAIGSIYQAKTLYSNGNGTQSTITFSESIYNYTYLRVYYRSNDWYWGSSIAVPDARIALTSGTATSSKTYFKTTVVTLSGTTLTFGNSSECSINTSGAAGMGTSNNIYVLRVIGYK